jgi:hypothetical protein
MIYLSPCGRGRRVAAGEGYFRAAQVLKRFQKALRAHQMNAESRLWYYLRSRRFQGWKFRRQHMLQGSNLKGVLETILDTPHPPLRGDLSHKGRGKQA